MTRIKLIRHRIPQIAADKGETMRTITVEDKAQYIQLLTDKLTEEVAEFLLSSVRQQKLDTEELADVYEVVLALRNLVPGGAEEFDRVKWKKWNERGGFMRGVALVTED